MIASDLAIRWESLAMAVGALALALWAFRSPAAPEPADRSAETSAVALRVVRPGQPAAEIVVRDGCLLGRGRDCDITFDDSSVSKMHARLHLAGGVATIEDLDSTNGTLLNGKRLEGIAALRRGDRIGLGTNQIVYLGAPSQEDL
jgi:FHA domain-containing protein